MSGNPSKEHMQDWLLCHPCACSMSTHNFLTKQQLRAHRAKQKILGTTDVRF